MVMNNKGQMMILKIMLAIVVLIMAIIFVIPVKESIDTNTNVTDFNCSSSDLSTGNKAACVVVDMLLFYILGAAISVSMAFIAGKKNVSGVVTGIVVFVVVSILIEPLKELIIIARSSSFLNCASGTLSVGGRLSCILIDFWLFWFAITALSAAIVYIVAKKVLPE